jgi:hypothetical protein
VKCYQYPVCTSSTITSRMGCVVVYVLHDEEHDEEEPSLLLLLVFYFLFCCTSSWYHHYHSCVGCSLFHLVLLWFCTGGCGRSDAFYWDAK